MLKWGSLSLPQCPWVSKMDLRCTNPVEEGGSWGIMSGVILSPPLFRSNGPRYCASPNGLLVGIHHEGGNEIRYRYWGRSGNDDIFGRMDSNVYLGINHLVTHPSPARITSLLPASECSPVKIASAQT